MVSKKNDKNDDSWLSDIGDFVSDHKIAIAATVVTGVMLIASGGTIAPLIAEEGNAAASAIGSRFAGSGAESLFFAAKSKLTDIAAKLTLVDLPVTVKPYVQNLISKYGSKAASQVFDDLKNIPLDKLSPQMLKDAIGKRFGAQAENAIFAESKSVFATALRNIRANPADQSGVVNFLVNAEERAQMVENANRRFQYAMMRGEVLGSNSFGNKARRTAKRAGRAFYDYYINPASVKQRFVASAIKGFVKGQGSFIGGEIHSVLPGRKTFLIRKYIAQYRRYTNKRILFGAKAKSSREIGLDFVKYILGQQAFTPELTGQAVGYAAGRITMVEGAKYVKGQIHKRKARQGTVHVKSYKRDGYTVKAYDRRGR